MTDKIELNKELIRNNPNLSGNEIYQKSKKEGIGIRKTNFLGLVREVRKLPEPSIEKREQSIPIKHKKYLWVKKLDKIEVKRHTLSTKQAIKELENTIKTEKNFLRIGYQKTKKILGKKIADKRKKQSLITIKKANNKIIERKKLLKKLEKPISIKPIKPIKPIEPSKIKYPTKEGQYGIVEIDGIDINGNKITKWIKYNNKKDFNNQLDFLKEKYQIERFSIIPHGIHSYSEFIDQEFERELQNLGIFL